MFDFGVISIKVENVMLLSLLIHMHGTQKRIDSDHFTIEVHLNWTKNTLKNITRKVYDTSKANFPDLKQHLSTLDHTYITDHTLDIDVKWNTWYNTLIDVLNYHIPQKKLGKTNTPPWIDFECIKLIRKKNRTLSKAKKSKNPETEKKFRVLRNRIKNLTVCQQSV